MDNEYLKQHLLKTIILCTKKEEQESCFCDIIDGKFVFGYVREGKPQVNRVTKQIAIAIAMGLNYYITFNKVEEPVKETSKKIIRRRNK